MARAAYYHERLCDHGVHFVTKLMLFFPQLQFNLLSKPQFSILLFKLLLSFYLIRDDIEKHERRYKEQTSFTCTILLYLTTFF
jgi:hypothetical protein